MGAAVHPVGVGADGQEGGLGAEVAEGFALGLGVGGGTGLGWGGSSPREAYAYVGGLDFGAVREKEVAEGNGFGDAEESLRIFVALLDAAFECG